MGFATLWTYNTVDFCDPVDIMDQEKRSISEDFSTIIECVGLFLIQELKVYCLNWYNSLDWDLF